MAYTETDLAEIEDAIRKLQRGERVVSVSYDGRTVNYGQVDLTQLLTLRDRMKGEVQSSTGKRIRQIRLSSRKGVN